MKKTLALIIGVVWLITAAMPLNQNDMGRLFDKGIAPGATYPVSLADAKKQLKLEVSDTSQDDLLQDYIEAATDEAERYIEQDIVAHLYMLELEQWHQDMILPKQPVKAVNKITYVDSNGDVQELSADKYELLPDEANHKIMLLHYKEFDALPEIDTDNIRAVVVYFETGMEKVPKGIGQAIKRIMTNNYDNRGDIVERLPRASENLLRKYRKYS